MVVFRLFKFENLNGIKCEVTLEAPIGTTVVSKRSHRMERSTCSSILRPSQVSS